MRFTPFTSRKVAAKFKGYPPRVRHKLMTLCELIFRTAKATADVGEIEETLKWGEPAYVTKNGSGSTVRIDWKAKTPGRYAMYFHCQTNLFESFRTRFPRKFTFEGNRAIVFSLEDPVSKDALARCISTALTYHLNKRRGAD